MNDRRIPCRLIVDGPAAGAWQMAVDDVLLASAAERGCCTLRFYRWSEPTLSLGYFQVHAERAMHQASRDCPLVRRQTGGGAILHDFEQTYSLAMPVTGGLATNTTQLYDVVHQALIEVLSHWSVAARLCRETPQLSAAEQPFLCFKRRACGDILVESQKICGSAQKSRRAAVLQHGSLLLAKSENAPELPGIAEISGKHLPYAELVEDASRNIAGRLGLMLANDGLTAAENDAVRSLALEKYDTARWNQRR